MNKLFAMAGLMGLAIASFTSCDNDGLTDNLASLQGAVTLTDEAGTALEIGPKVTFTTYKFTCLSNWTAKVESANTSGWISLRESEGVGGYKTLNIITKEFNIEYYNDAPVPTAEEQRRTATITISCGASSEQFTLTQTASLTELVHGTDDIPDIDKFYLPARYNEGFEKGADGMKQSTSKYCWSRMRQSEHFFLFWEAGYGDDPNSEANGSRRVDVDDFLQKAEKFYETNISRIKMATVGQNKSYLDKYKMEIFLLWTDDWVCAGSGYDNVVGALWVNHQPCQPVGSSVAHEVGHSFQYQTYCDQVLNGASDDSHSGYRYGFGPNGDGGCAYWEQCAQWQSFQDYPQEAYDQTWYLFTQNAHRHFNHEWMRYQSIWFQYYFVQKHGIYAFGNIWQQSHYPEDPIDTYTRLYCGGDYERFYDDYYDYAAHAVTFDFDAVRQYIPANANTNFSTSMLEVNGKYRPAYVNCVGTTGFNVIRLNTPAAGITVRVNLSALPVGSALAPTDGGVEIDVDGKSVATHSTYNTNVYDGQTYTQSGYRFGLVGIKGGKATYGAMAKGSTGIATFDVADSYDYLYLVVVGAPTTYVHQYWNDKEADDLQWPYEVSFEGTSLFGSFDIDPTQAPADITLTYSARCITNLDKDYYQGAIDLSGSLELAQAFVMQPNEISSLIQSVGAEPAEGTIVWAMLQADGTYSYKNTANGGFWCDTQGNNVGWGDGSAYVEFSGLSVSYGQFPGKNAATDFFTLTPTLIYTKGGKQYKAAIQLQYTFQ